VPVDECHLAELRGSFVGGDVRADDLLAARRVHFDRPAAFEPHVELADDVALDL